MAHKNKDIEILKGKTNPHILLIAPHASIIGKIPKNDRNTGIIVKQIQKTLQCSAIRNAVYRKPPDNGAHAQTVLKFLDKYRDESEDDL